MRRLVVLVSVLAMTLLGLVAVGLPAQGSIPPGTNGKIIFGQVFPNLGVTINPDGSDEQQIGPQGSTTCNTWSPDSSKVLCNLWSEDSVQPATANPDGSDFTLLNPNLPLDLFCLSWSPDGTRLLCHSEGIANPADAGLYTVRSSDAGDLVRVTATPPDGFDNGYGYAPDGSRILFSRFNSTGFGFDPTRGVLFSVTPDGGDAVQLSPSNLGVIDLGFFDRAGADWSPDGSQVTFAARKLSSGREFRSALFVVNADGTGLRQVTPSALGAISAQWSPNGGLIAFGSCCAPEAGAVHAPEAWVVDPDGTGLRKVTIPVGGEFSLVPVWSPDSTKLLFNRENSRGQTSLWTANVDGSGLSKVTDTAHRVFYAWGSAPVG
jgi:Tol biopolymer transport system component